MKLSQLSDRLAARHLGADPDLTGIASLHSATSADLSFVEDPGDFGAALQSSAGALVVGEFAATTSTSKPLLIARQPKLAFARAARILLPPSRRGSGAHPTAVIHDTAQLGRDVIVQENAVIAESACGVGSRPSSIARVNAGGARLTSPAAATR